MIVIFNCEIVKVEDYLFGLDFYRECVRRGRGREHHVAPENG